MVGSTGGVGSTGAELGVGADVLDVGAEELVGGSAVVLGVGDGATGVGAELLAGIDGCGLITGLDVMTGAGALVETSVVGRLNPSSVTLSWEAHAPIHVLATVNTAGAARQVEMRFRKCMSVLVRFRLMDFQSRSPKIRRDARLSSGGASTYIATPHDVLTVHGYLR